VCGPASATADRVPWAEWQGDPAHTGARSTGPEPPYRQAWRFAASDDVVSAPVFAGDAIVAVGRKAVYGIDPSTGDVSWTIDREGGAVAAPAVGRSGGTSLLYVDQPPKGGQASLVAVDMSTRKERWRASLDATSRSGVTVAGTTAFLGDEDGHVYAVRVADGTIEWTASVPGGVSAAPTISGGTVVVSVRDTDAQRPRIIAFDASTGSRRWSYAPPSSGGSPSNAAAGGGLVYAGFPDRAVRALDDSGAVDWSSLSLSLFSPVAGPAVASASGGSDAVYASDVAGGVYRLDAASGERSWDYQLNALVVRGSPVVVGDRVLLGLGDGRLVALDAASGHLVWQSVASPGLIGAIAVSGDLVVAVKGGARAGLIAWTHDPSGHLVDVVSPTRVDPIGLVGRYAAALVIVLIVLLLPFRSLRSRIDATPAAVVPDAGESAEDDGDDR